MKAVVFTLGCKVNECESDSIISGLSSLGYEVSDKLEYADVYVINTCAVTKEAEKKSRQTATRVKKLNPFAKIIFTGCACQKEPSSFTDKDKNFLVTGVYGKNKIISMLSECGEKILQESKDYEELFPVKTMRSRAFIKVEDGCNNFCSYCIIPYLRGRVRSRNPENVVKEISSLSPLEAVLTGINLSAYSFNGEGLSGLIRELKGLNTRIRLGSLEVGVIDQKFLTELKNLNNFAPHFHLSLQSGSNDVLKKMNRHYTAKEYIEKVDLIREFFPNAGITTDIIAGFPTETEKDFNDTLSLIDRVKFSDIHPFTFSRREGTVAYKMKDLPFSLKKERTDKLLEKKKECKGLFIDKMINTEQDFLFEYFKDGYAEGYSGNYLRLYVKDFEFNGKIQKVRTVKPYKDGLIAEIIK